MCCWMPVAHACNPSYSGGRDQEDRGSKPARANSLRDPISKNPKTKRAGGVAQSVGPQVQIPVSQKKKKKCVLVDAWAISTLWHDR
jgi:hypothetical protein